jgi:hypothetical protein
MVMKLLKFPEATRNRKIFSFSGVNFLMERIGRLVEIEKIGRLVEGREIGSKDKSENKK